MRKTLTVLVSVVVGVMMVANVSAFPPATWNEGDEEAIFGHTFDEEYWTNESMKAQSPAGDNLTFSASYVNFEGVQAFLLCLNMVENDDGVGAVPFQLFGMHYSTPEGREVFIAAELAFLMAFDDTYNGTGPGQNGLPDPGHENVTYVIPFGVSETLSSAYPPDVNVRPVEKLGEGHYRFGIQYLNLYAFVSPTLASAFLRSGWIAKFSELSIDYEITMDNKTGVVKAETWYTLGQVTELWFLLFGIPISLNPRDIPDTMGLSVVHFVTVFSSRYQGASVNSTGASIDTGINAPIDDDIVLSVGDDKERAMKIGTRGTFDLINESSGLTVKNDEPALNAIVGAQLVDLFLVAWQLGFSAGVMSIFAYGLSDYVRSQYSGPLDLAQRSLLPSNKDGFNAFPMWYAVSFPQWNGYRVVHDPVYTAYTDLNIDDATEPLNLGGVVVLLLIVIVIVAVAVAVATRKKG